MTRFRKLVLSFAMLLPVMLSAQTKSPLLSGVVKTGKDADVTII